MLKRLAILALALFAAVGITGCFVPTSGHYVTTHSVYYYYGSHPVYDIHGHDDWCTISGRHTHSYAPDHDDFYVVNDGYYVFTGDPSYYVSNLNFNTYYYMGHHPLPVGNGWCYINGAHRHTWASNSGYYNYTTYGSYQYYVYYGPTNRYYDTSHRTYNLYTYYQQTPPPRYGHSNGRHTVGMSTRPAPNMVAQPGNMGRPSYVGQNGNMGRPGGSSVTVGRPSSSVTPSNGPGYVNGTPSNTVSRPSTVNRPTASTPSNTVSRPSTVNRPTVDTVSRPSSVNRPSSVSRPSSVNRPSSSSTGRVDYPTSNKTQYTDDDEDENKNSGSSASGRSRGVRTSSIGRR